MCVVCVCALIEINYLFFFSSRHTANDKAKQLKNKNENFNILFLAIPDIFSQLRNTAASTWSRTPALTPSVPALNVHPPAESDSNTTSEVKVSGKLEINWILSWKIEIDFKTKLKLKKKKIR